MKKLFVMLLSLAVLGLPAFAQKMDDATKAAIPVLNGKVAKAASDARDGIVKGKAIVLKSLQNFREVTEKRKEFNGSFTLQDMMDLMDNYLALYGKSASAALSLNDEINKPIKAGWGQTVTIPQLIRDNIQHVFAGSTTAGDLEYFAELLGKKAAPQAEKQLSEKQAAVLESLKYFRKSTEARKEFNGSFTLQNMMDLMDNYLALYQKSESEALALNKEINKPIKAGWGQTVTIPQLIRDNIQHVFAGSSTALDLEFFADLLIKDVK